MAVVIAMTNVKINKPEQLDVINDIIHDCYFKISDVVFDSESSTMTFKFRRPVATQGVRLRDFVYRSKTRPTTECLLRIYRVEGYSVEDAEGVEIYDFDVLEFDSSTSSIRVKTNIPIDSNLAVLGCEISVEQG